MRDILLVAFFFMAIYYSFKKPYLGVSAWIWIALTAPTKWAFGFSTSLRMNFTIVIVTFISYLFAFKDKKLSIGSIGFFIILFLIQCLISTLAQDTINSENVTQDYIEHVKTALLFIFTALILRTKHQIITFVWCIVLSISSYAGMEAVKFLLSGGGHQIVGRAGIIIDRNDLAVAINMSLPLVFFLISVTENKLVKKGLWFLAILNIVAVIGTYSRGGFIGLSIIAIAAWLKSDKKLIWALLAFTLLPLLYHQTPEEWRERQSTVSTAATEDSSFIGRLWAWKISALIALDDPLTGAGYKAVTDPMLWRYYAPYTPGFGPIETPEIPVNLAPKAAHNIYMQVLGDHGFVGLLLFLIILAKCFLANRANQRKARIHQLPWLENFCSALNVSIVGYCITGMNVSLAYFDLIYAVIGLVVVCNFILREISKQNTNNPSYVNTRQIAGSV
ncbi:putative O-glycosylation ligase, exosortase A system-associated [Rheinheimera sp.]|uniref:putative O-glycosylation ligase, exosortase A system-associated n=1 Tax=Rheinheimera sp. TaxID=1869214 RepID=UPI002FDEDBEB